MAKTKINRAGWGAASNVFYVGAMRTTDNRCAAVETENAAWLQAHLAAAQKYKHFLQDS